MIVGAILIFYVNEWDSLLHELCHKHEQTGSVKHHWTAECAHHFAKTIVVNN